MNISLNRFDSLYLGLEFDERGRLLSNFSDSIKLVISRIEYQILSFKPRELTLESSETSIPLELISIIYLRVVHATSKVYMDDSLVAAHG